MATRNSFQGSFPQGLEQPRSIWTNQIQFLLSCVGYAVGLGNIWRFPYLCYKHGGGAFLIPYFIFVFSAALPLFLLEVSLGQMTRQGSLTLWYICPSLKGIGIGMSILATYSNVYYIIILSWSLIYFYDSFSTELPWGSCENWWNTSNCTDRDMAIKEYWNNRVLNKSSGLEDIGTLQPQLVLTLAIAWITVFACICRGVKSSGKVVYITALFPYIMIIALMIRGITLPGAHIGIRYYLYPDISRLSSSSVWYDAATQVMYTYGLAIGAMIALGSYNQPGHNYTKDCLIIAFLNTTASILGGVAVFSTLGFMSHFGKVATNGPGLAFEVYPRALIEMPGGPVWSVIFFVMILFIEGVVTSLVDQFPEKLAKTENRRTLFLSIVCLLLFLAGLPMTLGCGIYVFEIFNYYAYSGIVLMTFCLAEISGVAYGFPLYKFVQLHYEKSGRMPNRILQVVWIFVTPAVTLAILIFSIIRFEPLILDDYEYPKWAIAVGIGLTLSSIIPIPVYSIYYHINKTKVKSASVDVEMTENAKSAEEVNITNL